MKTSEILKLYPLRKGSNMGHRLISSVLSYFDVDANEEEFSGTEEALQSIYEALMGPLGLLLVMKAMQKSRKDSGPSTLRFEEHENVEEAIRASFMRDKGEYDIQRALIRLQGDDYCVLDYQRLTSILIGDRMFLIEEDPDLNSVTVRIIPAN